MKSCELLSPSHSQWPNMVWGRIWINLFLELSMHTCSGSLCFDQQLFLLILKPPCTPEKEKVLFSGNGRQQDFVLVLGKMCNTSGVERDRQTDTAGEAFQKTHRHKSGGRALLRSLYKLRSSYISATWSSLNAMNFDTQGQIGSWMMMSNSMISPLILNLILRFMKAIIVASQFYQY